MSTSYPIDLTAAASSNYIETNYTRTKDGDWVIIPDGGAFYTLGLSVVNSFNNNLLQPLVQYTAMSSLNVKQAVLDSGKEICTSIVIKDNNVNQVTIKRQIVGGDYAEIGSSVSNLFTNIKLDSLSSTTWGQVIGEPFQFPPEIHYHVDPTDLYGFDTSVQILDKIREGLTVGDGGVFGMFYQYIEQRVAQVSASYNQEIKNLKTQLDNAQQANRYKVGDIILRSDNRYPGDADIEGYGTWTRLPNNTLLMLTTDDNLLGTTKKVGEGVDQIATYFAGWQLTSL